MKFLSCVWRYYKKFGHNPRISDVIRILRGESGKAAADPAWKTLSTWKIGEDFSQRDWEGIVRRLFVLGLLGLEESAEKRCCLTDKALSFLKNPEPVLIRARQKP
jgi:superfamily II DNA helicase RecQ